MPRTTEELVYIEALNDLVERAAAATDRSIGGFLEQVRECEAIYEHLLRTAKDSEQVQAFSVVAGALHTAANLDLKHYKNVDDVIDLVQSGLQNMLDGNAVVLEAGQKHEAGEMLPIPPATVLDPKVFASGASSSVSRNKGKTLSN